MKQPAKLKLEFQVEEYRILKQSVFDLKISYVVDLHLSSPHRLIKGDEVRNVAGERWIVTHAEPGKITIIGDSMDHLLEMIGLWGIGEYHYKLE